LLFAQSRVAQLDLATPEFASLRDFETTKLGARYFLDDIS
jgi:hypothetical protein